MLDSVYIRARENTELIKQIINNSFDGFQQEGIIKEIYKDKYKVELDLINENKIISMYFVVRKNTNSRWEEIYRRELYCGSKEEILKDIYVGGILHEVILPMNKLLKETLIAEINFNPIDMLVTKLKTNKAGLKEYNKRIDEIESMRNFNLKMKKVKSINDLFYNYSLIEDDVLNDPLKTRMRIVKENNRSEDKALVSIDSDTWLLKTIGEINLENTYDYIYGVADNAEQIINKYFSKDSEEYLDLNAKYIIVLEPVIRICQPERNGWRWHKWGEYIGIQNPQAEYLYSEDNIDIVFTYDVLKVLEE